MLRFIVESAIHWMQIGLPLRLLKVVIFSRTPNDEKRTSSDPLCSYFQEIKDKWLKKLEKEKTKKVVGKILTFTLAGMEKDTKKVLPVFFPDFWKTGIQK